MWGKTLLRLTTPHMKSDKVKAAQELLHHNRWGVDFRPGLSDGEYGPLTAHAALRAKYYLGYRVKASNYNLDFGPELHSYLVPKDDAAHAQLPLAYKARYYIRRKRRQNNENINLKRYNVALSQVGYHGSGWAGLCSKYASWYGLPCENWCAMFVSWCDNQAGGHFRYSYVPFIVGDAAAGRNGLSLTSTPQRGRTLVCFDWTGDGLWDHVEIFDSWENSSYMWTIGGNTGSTNGVPGGEVVRQVRYVGIRHAFVNIK